MGTDDNWALIRVEPRFGLGPNLGYVSIWAVPQFGLALIWVGPQFELGPNLGDLHRVGPSFELGTDDGWALMTVGP